MDKIYVFHLGLQHADQTALGLQEAGLLDTFATTRFYIEGRMPYRLVPLLEPLLPKRTLGRLRQRSNTGLKPENVTLFGAAEWTEVLFKAISPIRIRRRIGDFGYKYFTRRVMEDVSRKPDVRAVWGYNNYSYDVFEHAKKLGKKTILDMTIGHIVEEDAARMHLEQRGPTNWFVTPALPFVRQIRELQLADRIVAGSDFVAETLRRHRVPNEKIVVRPYGYSETLFGAESVQTRSLGDGPLKILFVGQIDVRKGADALIAAVSEFGDDAVQLTLVGNYYLPINPSHLPSNVKILPFQPRAQLAHILLGHHIFCLPSNFEGSALVVYEALATGAPVICSPEAGHDAEKIGGLSVESGSASALKACFMRILEDRDMVRRMSKATIAVRQNYTWRVYRKGVAEIAQEVLS